MKAKVYPLISGIVFGIMAIMHGVRMVDGIEVFIGGHLVPVGLSLPIFFFFGFLSAWAFYELVKALNHRP